jgi:hypothetical protein
MKLPSPVMQLSQLLASRQLAGCVTGVTDRELHRQSVPLATIDHIVV